MYRVYYYTFDYSKYYDTMAEAHAAGQNNYAQRASNYLSGLQGRKLEESAGEQ